MSNTEKWMCIDGNSLLYRAFFAVPPLHRADGTPTNALYGFVNTLLALLATEQPDRVYVAWDAEQDTFRHQVYTAYKAGRPPTPPDLRVQRPLLQQLLTTMRVVQYTVPGYEADDIIGTIARQATALGRKTVILTGDRDLLQLVSPTVTVFLPKKGTPPFVPYTPQTVLEQYGIQPDQLIDLKGLMGDTSDNIPGCPGIGPKTGEKLLREYATLEQVLANAEHITGKVGQTLRSYADQARLSKQLATIDCHVPLPPQTEEEGPPDVTSDEVMQQFLAFGFRSLLEKRGGTVTDVPKQSALSLAPPPNQIAPEDVADWVRSFSSTPCTLHVELSGDNPHRAEWIGLAVLTADGHVTVVFADVVLSDAGKPLREWLEHAERPKMVTQSLDAATALQWHGITLRGVTFDLFLAAYIGAPTAGAETIQDWVQHMQGTSMPTDATVYGPKVVRDRETMATWMATKVRAMHHLEPIIRASLQGQQLNSLYETMELPLVPLLVKMMGYGVRIDEDALHAYGVSLQHRLEQCKQEVWSLAGKTFNINSPKQLGEVLFEHLKLPMIKKTTTGYATSIDVLEKLRTQHPVIEAMIVYRHLAKLHSAYVESLAKEVHPITKRVHTVFRQTIAATGRLSSQHPNIQTIPVRTEEGRRIRQMVVPSQPGWVLMAADYSQIELRLLAHLSQDERMMEAFHNDVDIHTQTAMNVFGVAQQAVDETMRRQAKAVNFGIVYGMSDFTLSQNVNIPRKEATEFIDTYFHVYRGVKRYMDDIVAQAKKDGYVTTLFHRTRPIPDINASNYHIRSFAERTAMNTPIQGSAADVIKLAMLRVDQQMQEANVRARLLLQVHDELVFELPSEEVAQMVPLVRKAMEQAVSLTVPLSVSIAVGPNWDDVESVD